MGGLFKGKEEQIGTVERSVFPGRAGGTFKDPSGQPVGQGVGLEPFTAEQPVFSKRQSPLLRSLAAGLIGFSDPGAAQSFLRQQDVQEQKKLAQLEKTETRKHQLALKKFEQEESLRPIIQPVEGGFRILDPRAMRSGDLKNALRFHSTRNPEELLSAVEGVNEIKFSDEERKGLTKLIQSGESELFTKQVEVIRKKAEAEQQQQAFIDSFNQALPRLEALYRDSPPSAEQRTQGEFAIEESLRRKSVQPILDHVKDINNEARADKRSLRSASAQAGILKPIAQMNVEDRMRDDYEKKVRDFAEVRDHFDRIRVAEANPSPASDIALIFAYMKLLDPQSVVRESEFATAANAAGVPDRTRRLYNNLLKGDKLAPAQRADFINQARQVFKKVAKRKLEVDEQFRGIAERRGLNPENIIQSFGFEDEVSAEDELEKDLRNKPKTLKKK